MAADEGSSELVYTSPELLGTRETTQRANQVLGNFDARIFEAGQRKFGKEFLAAWNFLAAVGGVLETSMGVNIHNIPPEAQAVLVGGGLAIAAVGAIQGLRRTGQAQDINIEIRHLQAQQDRAREEKNWQIPY